MKMQKPPARSRVAWWPGGRVSAKDGRRGVLLLLALPSSLVLLLSPSRVCRAASIQAALARRQAS